MKLEFGTCAGSVSTFDVKLNTVELLASSGFVCLRMITAPQLVRFTGIGAMKSLSAELKASDDRDLTNIEPKLMQVFGPLERNRRSNCASPKVRGA